VTSQKTPFFIVTAVKTLKLTFSSYFEGRAVVSCPVATEKIPRNSKVPRKIARSMKYETNWCGIALVI
jgi:hypothetical protein